MTCDKVFQQILDFALIKFQTDCSTPEEAFIDSVVEFFSNGCGKDLYNLYSDFDFKCKSYLMSEFKKIKNPYKFGLEISQKIVRIDKSYNEYLKEYFNEYTNKKTD